MVVSLEDVDQSVPRRGAMAARAVHAAELAAMHDWLAGDAAGAAVNAEQELDADWRRYCQRRHHEQPLRRPASAEPASRPRRGWRFA